MTAIACVLIFAQSDLSVPLPLVAPSDCRALAAQLELNFTFPSHSHRLILDYHVMSVIHVIVEIGVYGTAVISGGG